MTSTIKGLRINVTVGLSINAEEIKESSFRQRPEYRKDTSDNYGKNIKIGAEAGFDMQVDSYEGEIDLKELGDIIKNNLHGSIREQVKEQLDEQLHQNNKKEG